MSINNLNFATKMTDELDRAAQQKSVTGFLADNSMRVKFVGAKTVLIPEVETSGLGTYDRDAGFSTGAVSVSSNSYVLSQDRGRSFQLDSEDYDETGIADLAGKVLGEFVRTRVVPEVDAYCLSKMAAYAVSKNQTFTGTPATDAYAMFSEAVSAAQNAVGFDEEMVAFVDPTMWVALQNSDEVSRVLEVGSFRKGEVDMQVRRLNGVTILPVPAARMKTAFEFLDGTTSGETDGGFTVASGAKSIGMLLIPKRAASLVKKTEKIRTFDPAHNLKADAWKFDYRLYYDLFIRNGLADGIRAYVYTAA